MLFRDDRVYAFLTAYARELRGVPASCIIFPCSLGKLSDYSPVPPALLAFILTRSYNESEHILTPTHECLSSYPCYVLYQKARYVE